MKEVETLTTTEITEKKEEKSKYLENEGGG